MLTLLWLHSVLSLSLLCGFSSFPGQPLKDAEDDHTSALHFKHDSLEGLCDDVDGSIPFHGREIQSPVTRQRGNVHGIPGLETQRREDPT